MTMQLMDAKFQQKKYTTIFELTFIKKKIHQMKEQSKKGTSHYLSNQISK